MSSAQSPHRIPVATTDLLDLLTRFRWARGRMDDRVERDDYGPGKKPLVEDAEQQADFGG